MVFIPTEFGIRYLCGTNIKYPLSPLVTIKRWYRAHLECGRPWVRAPIRSNQRLWNWYVLLLP